MSMTLVDDYKLNGEWVKVRTIASVCTITRAARYWYNMQARAKEGGSYQKTFPSYNGVSCGFESFQEFANWCQTQISYTSGFSLDKDVLGNGRQYQKDVCVFIPGQINNFFTDSRAARGEYPVGVTKRKGRYIATISDGTGRRKMEALGSYGTVEEAYAAYKDMKEAKAKALAEKWKDVIDPRVYDVLSNYKLTKEHYDNCL